MSAPAVSFVIPCYKLAHLLPECVNSILGQTYDDFEVLIMDDCSPDDTPRVAQSFSDSRVRHIRNEKNLGHLRNYNKGIELATGEYIWLVSADDRLLTPNALSQYVAIMHNCPTVGYICSSAVEIRDGRDPELAGYTKQAEHDTVFRGHDLLRKLLYSNSIVASSGLVRKSCYKELGSFPLDLPYAGDWYLWCLFALHYDVGYCAEPLVGYRIHDRSMTASFINEDVQTCVRDCLAVLWRIKEKSQEAGRTSIVALCERAIGYAYAQEILGRRYRHCQSRLTVSECRESIEAFTTERIKPILGRVYESLADLYFQEGKTSQASEAYWHAIRLRPDDVKLYVKAGLLMLGFLGVSLRRRLHAIHT